jgi:hypothetical protein
VTLEPEEEQLAALRAVRDEALALVRDDIEALKLDLEARGLGSRIADRVGEGARDVWEQALEVAAAYRSIVAGVVLAIVAWLLRGRIGRALFGGDREGDEDGDEEAGKAKGAPSPAEQSQEQGERT